MTLVGAPAKRSSAVTATLTALLIVCLGSAVLLLRHIDRMRSDAALEEVLYIPSPKMLKRMSLGYSGLAADIYWTRAVQYFGAKHRFRSKQYPLLAPLLDITTELDPRLIVAYQFGSTFLAQKPPDGAGQPQKAVELVERGIRANPDNWRLYYQLGFLQYMELHDYAAAAQAFERGSQVPNAHPFLKVLAASMAQHAGETQMARLLWATTYETTQDAMIRDNAVKHLTALKVDEDVRRLEGIVVEYRKKAGQLPATWSAMIEAHLLTRIPVDPVGHTYKLKPNGQVEVADPDALPFITQGLPPGKEPEILDKSKT